MSTAVAVGAAASSAASAAAAQQAARRAECFASMPRFNEATASIEEKRDYADCVRTIYGTGEPTPESVLILGKVFVGLLLLALVSGVFRAMAQPYRDWFDFVAYPFLHFVVVLAAGAILFLLAAGLAFLFA